MSHMKQVIFFRVNKNVNHSFILFNKCICIKFKIEAQNNSNQNFYNNLRPLLQIRVSDVKPLFLRDSAKNYPNPSHSLLQKHIENQDISDVERFKYFEKHLAERDKSPSIWLSTSPNNIAENDYAPIQSVIFRKAGKLQVGKYMKSYAEMLSNVSQQSIKKLSIYKMINFELILTITKFTKWN